jgi:nickel-type superoxide dismutase maturation protease
MLDTPNQTCPIIVNGDSMWPTICDGDQVVCEVGYYESTKPRVGDVVLCIHPLKPSVRVIKRISQIHSGARVFLKGDNPDPIATTDSHAFGLVAREQLLGRILISPKS